jgi:hypothetical protein
MRVELKLRPEVRDMWKMFPIRIQGNSTSPCCKQPTLLVQSMEGGYVTRNCSECGKKQPLSNSAFLDELNLWVACPVCKRRMQPGIFDKNYGFGCDTCNGWLKLSDLLPWWEEIA